MGGKQAGSRADGNRQVWPGVEFRHLAALAAVAREGSFADAAYELGYVQSAVSQQIADLERSVGTRLLERRRGAGDVTVTDAGRLLLQHVDPIYAELERARVELDEVQAGAAGTLRLGVWDCVAVRLMPLILRSLSARIPHLKLQMEISLTDRRLAEWVRAGEVQVAFGQLPLSARRLNFAPLLVDPYVLVVPASWPIASDEGRMTPEKLADLPLIGTGDQFVETALSQTLEEAGAEASYVTVAEGNGAVQALVAAGRGAALIPRMALDYRQETITALDANDLVAPRQIVVYWPGGAIQPPGVAAFIDAASLACGARLTGPPVSQLAAEAA
jgi:molybdate transport repressor ModE-like protein